MAIKYKDYYEILGVPRRASREEIRTAYRKLARKYHPDVSGGKPGMEDKFKEINEAHEVLKDPEKREKYDSMGRGMEYEGAFAGGFRPHRGAEGRAAAGGWTTTGGEPENFGFNFGGTGFSDFFETFFGSRRMGGDPFGGIGAETGRGRAGPMKGADLEADIMVTLEEAIHGSTRQLNVERGGPGGSRNVETYQVKIPPGVRQGQRIRLAGKGEPGTGTGASPGDLFLRVRLSEHPDFRVEGSDLYYDLPLAPWEAALGARVEVPTPSGKASLHISSGASSGKKFRLRNQGLPKEGGGKGDFYVVAQVKTPSHTSSAEKALWEELAKVSTFDPRKK